MLILISQKICLAIQPLRVEGWAVNFGAGLTQQKVKEDFMCLAVNGLNSKGLRDPCHGKDDRTWKSLATLLHRITEQENEKSLFHEPIQTASQKSNCDTRKTLYNSEDQDDNNRNPSKASKVDNGVVMSAFDHFKKVKERGHGPI